MKWPLPTLSAVLCAGGIAFAASTIPLGNMTDAYNGGAVYCSVCMTITGSNPGAGSRMLSFNFREFEQFGVDPDGAINVYSSIQNAYNVNLRGVGIVQANTTSHGIGSQHFSFGSIGNISANLVAMTGKAIGALSSCGSSPTIKARSSDFQGQVTGGSGATGCTIAWSETKTNTPTCNLSSPDGASLTWAESTTNVVVTGSVASKKIVWTCTDG